MRFLQMNTFNIQLNLCKTATLKIQNNGLQTDYRLMHVKRIAECSKVSIL